MLISQKQPPSVKGYGFFKRLFGHQRHLRDPSVTRQVVAGAVGTSHDLDPALRRGVPRQVHEDNEGPRGWTGSLTYEVLVSASQQSQA